MARVSSHWLRRRETFSWKVCLYPYFAGMCYSMSTTFIYPFSLKLPFRWGGLLIFLNVYFLGYKHILWRSMTLYMKENSWKRCEKSFEWWELLSTCQFQHDLISDLVFIAVSETGLFCLCKVDIRVKLVETSSERGFISLGKIEIAQNNDLKLRYWWNIVSMQTGVIY